MSLELSQSEHIYYNKLQGRKLNEANNILIKEKIYHSMSKDLNIHTYESKMHEYIDNVITRLAENKKSYDLYRTCVKIIILGAKILADLTSKKTLLAHQKDIVFNEIVRPKLADLSECIFGFFKTILAGTNTMEMTIRLGLHLNFVSQSFLFYLKANDVIGHVYVSSGYGSRRGSVTNKNEHNNDIGVIDFYVEEFVQRIRLKDQIESELEKTHCIAADINKHIIKDWK